MKIGSDNTVSVVVASAEIGQGTHTGLAMVLADELDTDWSKVAIEAATDDRIYNNLDIKGERRESLINQISKMLISSVYQSR